MITRRVFLKNGAMALVGTAVVPSFLARAVYAADRQCYASRARCGATDDYSKGSGNVDIAMARGAHSLQIGLRLASRCFDGEQPRFLLVQVLNFLGHRLQPALVAVRRGLLYGDRVELLLNLRDAPPRRLHIWIGVRVSQAKIIERLLLGSQLGCQRLPDRDGGLPFRFFHMDTRLQAAGFVPESCQPSIQGHKLCGTASLLSF